MQSTGIKYLGAFLAGAVVGCSSSSSPTGVKNEDGGHGGTGEDASHGDSSIVKGDARLSPDAGLSGDAHAGSTPDSTVDASNDALDDKDGGHEAAVDASPRDASVEPQHLLVTFTGATTSEVVAVNVAAKAVDGRLGFAGFGVTDARNAASPFLLEQNADIVARLDAVKPWQIDSTWNVASNDAVDGGSLYSAPMQVVETATSAYVIRYDRNDVTVINASLNVDAGAPSSSISLAAYLQAGDSDGLVEMTAAAYVASSQRLYVVLANINQPEEASYGGVVCSGEVSTIVAIDTQTNTVVNLGGAGPSGSIVLTYYNPVSLAYDPSGDRLLIVGGGCYGKPTGAGTTLGPATLRGVEAIALGTGKSTSLLNLSAASFPAGFVDLPTGFAYIDATHAVLGFDQTGEAVYAWNPTSTTLGAVIPNAPDVFTYDGSGHLLGSRLDTSDAGVTSTAIVSVGVADGVSTTLATNVTSLTGDTYVGAVDVWPHP